MARVLWLVAVFSAALVLTAAAPAEEISKCTEENTSHSESSKQASAEILKYIDQSIDPCDDFYNFACGSYIKNSEISSDDFSVSQLGNINNVVLEQLHAIIKEPIDSNEPKWSKLTKQMYQTCYDTDVIDKRGLSTIKSILKDIGGWPVVEGDNWNDDKFHWNALLYKFAKQGLATGQFIEVKVQPLATNSSRRVITIGQPTVPLNHPILDKGFDDKTVKAYYDYLVDIAVLFGASKDTASVDFKAFIKFMADLSKTLIPPEDLRDLSAMTNIMTVEELQKKFPYVDWIEYLNHVLVIPNYKITEKDLVDVGMPKYLTNLETLLNKTSKRVLANYIITTTVTSLTQYLNQDIKDIEFAFNKATAGVAAVKPKWKECLEVVTENLPISSAALYARKYFTAEAKADVEKLISNLHEKFLEMLNNVDWMDDATKKEALEKAKDIQEHIAYPEELLDDHILNEYYKHLEVSEDYLQFSLNVDKFLREKMSESLLHPVERSDWKEHSVSHQVNAFYHLSENSIIVPSGILQGAVFKHERPKYMNYAGIGFVVGHELTHGFDDRGKQISKNRKLENWWSEATQNAYAEKAKCILDQYNDFKSEKLDAHVNGIVTLGENIADNGGLKLVYEAYEKEINVHGAEKCLPNLKYTPKQLFWISLANVWCTKSRDEYLKREMETSDHSPAMYRILGVVANSNNFAKDFNCPANAKMNSPKKCTFW